MDRRLSLRRSAAIIERVVGCIVVVGLFCGLSFCSDTWKADNGNGTFTNPLFYDEFSDPDMIRVGGDFYLTGTTMHAMPGLPILHSRDLVNWEFLGYTLDRLDLGPAFRLENGKNIYGQGIWAPCFRYHNGTFYIFSNVNGQTTQLFRAKNPAGPWTRTPMKRSFHDLSVLFDDDGKVYIVWGYQSIRMAQLTDDLTDAVPGTEREVIAPSAGMGEGLHLYRIGGKYFLTSAWYLDEMRMPTARADRITGPWEVNQNVSRGEDFGRAESHRIKWPYKEARPPFDIANGNPDAVGRAAMHQGGIVDTPTGEWWGFSMFEGNSVGRLTALSPVTWTDGWPYFGLPGNLGRTPRIWKKPNTGASAPASAPYRRSDDFSSKRLQPAWQWNHVPVDGQWSLAERPGYLRLHALPASDLLTAHNTLTQRAIGPRSTPTVVMDAAGMQPGDVAGLALLNRPYAWIGLERNEHGLTVAQFDEQTGRSSRVPLAGQRVWMRAECDFLNEEARFSYSTDGKVFRSIGMPFKTVYQLMTFQGVRYSLFSYNVSGRQGGFADFDSIEVSEPNPHGLTRPIPYGKQIELTSYGIEPKRLILASDGSVQAAEGRGSSFTVVDRGLGRVALRSNNAFISVAPTGAAKLYVGAAGKAETFQWIETFTGELTLMSLSKNRYLRLDVATGSLWADSPGPRPNGRDGVRWNWSVTE
jgi:beta-xylosidase